MATPTYELLDSTTLASSASSVTFTSIDQSYGDLVLVAEANSDITGGGDKPIFVDFNGDSTGSNYAYVYMAGNGSSATSAAASTVHLIGRTADQANPPALNIFQFMDYSATDKHTSSISRVNDTNGQVWAFATRWGNTAAVTSINLRLSSGNFDTGSTFYLYGIAK